MKTIFFLAAAAVALTTACNNSQKSESATDSASSSKHELVLKWETDSTLKVPESVLVDSINNVLYVSNIDGDNPWLADGKGSIGKVGMDGKILATEWVTGLNAPKGMGLYNGKLYAADLTDLVVIDIASGKIEKRIPASGAVGLNDIAIDKAGTIYVSDSPGKQVFKFTGDKAEQYLKDLNGPNGLMVQDDELYVLDKGAMHKVNADKSLTQITGGLEGNADGLENVKGKEYLISSWEGLVYYVNEDGTNELLLDTRNQNKNTADIGFNKKGNIVYIPTFFKNTVAAYEVK